MTVRQFAAICFMDREVFEAMPELRNDARQVVEGRLSVPLKGPRGGCYVPFGEITWSEVSGVDFQADRVMFKGKRKAKYTRRNLP